MTAVGILKKVFCPTQKIFDKHGFSVYNVDEVFSGKLRGKVLFHRIYISSSEDNYFGKQNFRNVRKHGLQR